MTFVVTSAVLQIVGVITCVLLGGLIYDRRFKGNHEDEVPKGFEKTGEINIDPVTNEKIRVYYNPETGERFYKKE